MDASHRPLLVHGPAEPVSFANAEVRRPVRTCGFPNRTALAGPFTSRTREERAGGTCGGRGRKFSTQNKIPPGNSPAGFSLHRPRESTIDRVFIPSRSGPMTANPVADRGQ
ncbi:hypothetical protein FRUB_04998 [Fimbriiglobus ruber]|uniref:Uncharacterized protein n=1 Tax=Fimbriiglobus ruber TaxID=1908690 RepID=A0A225DU27_9BACT|nr:hypothetical protein FRUB_04998 [Fimbriiglobus ruber]